MKVCTKCNAEKDEIEFNKNKNSKDGLKHTCKSCSLEYNNEWRKSNPGKRKGESKRYYDKNVDYIKSYKRVWVKKNIEKLSKQGLENGRKSTAELKDFYVKRLLKRSGVPDEQIENNPDIIQIKKIILKIQRLCKKKKGNQ